MASETSCMWTCDKCGKTAKSVPSDAYAAYLPDGWRESRDFGTDLCGECWEKFKLAGGGK